MKKSLISFFAMLLLASGIQVSAETTDYKYIVVQSKSGNATPFELDGLKLTFDGNQLSALLNGGKTDFALSDLAKMYFTDDITSVRPTTLRKNTAVSLEGATLRVNAPKGTCAKVYDTEGKLVMSTIIGQTGTPASINLLEQGIYVVKVGRQTTKFLVK